MRKRHRSLPWAANQLLNRSLQDISYRSNRGFAKPTRIIFCLTLRCNIHCRQCAIWRLPKKPEISNADWKRIILALRRWIGPYRAQIAGGEVFIRQDILDIIRYATEQDVLTGIISNGTLIDAKLAREIVTSGLGYIHISLDGITADVHDHIRGLDGVHKKTMAAIDHLIKANLEGVLAVSIATVINRINMHQLEDLVAYANQPGLNGIIFNPLGPTIDSDPNWYENNDLWFDDVEEINRIIDRLINLKRKGTKIINPLEQLEGMKTYFAKPYLLQRDGCRVGVTNLSINCDGSMHTCFKMPSLGNARDLNPKEAWNSLLAQKVRLMIKNCDVHCSPGNFVYRRSLLDEIRRFLRYG